MDPRTELAFDFAREIATQLLTLSTGFLALSVTFTKDIVKGPKGRTALYVAWTLQLVSIAAGIWTLMSLTRALARPEIDGAPVFDPGVRVFAAVQILMFFLSMAAIVWYGYRAFASDQGLSTREERSSSAE